MANKLLNLKVGSNGNDVKNLQTALMDEGYDVGKAGVDGVYGKDTEAAVKQYQKDNGLTIDGIAGKNTLGSLNDKKQAVLKGDDGEVIAETGVKSLAKKPPNNTKGQTGTTTTTTTTTTTDTKGKDEGKKDSAEEQKQTEVSKTDSTTQPFTYGDFNYDKEFQYDDFSYDKEFQHDPFSYDKEFQYDDFNYGKEFSYGDFNYDKEFSYGDFSYGDFSYGDYAESDAVKQANALLQQQLNSKPGEYQSQWQSQLDDYMNQIQNRDPFSYDFNSDALYNQYKDLYTQQGQMAMMDTMGQAAAMTGGYGNSYAQSVGQQAYNQQLSQLNSVMPELYKMAYDRYAQEGQDLYNQYNMLMGRESQDYGRYQDKLSNWHQDLDYLTGRYDTERNFDYGTWESGRNFAYDQYSSDRNLAYDQYSADKSLAYDQYSADKNMAFNKWSSDRDLAYDQFTSDRSLAYDQYSTDKSLAYDAYTADKSLAYDQYNADRNLAYDQYSTDKSMAYDQWDSNRDLAYDQYSSDKSLAYDKWSSDRNLAYDEYQNALNMAYQKDRDAVSDAQWQAEFDESNRRYEDSKKSSGSGTGSGKGTGDDGTTYKTMSTSDMWDLSDRFKKMEPEEALAWADRIASQNGYDPEVVRGIATQATGGQKFEEPDDTGLTESRQIEIEKWVANACANANGPSFDPNKLVKGSGYFANEKERAYAYEVVKAMSGTR